MITAIPMITILLGLFSISVEWALKRPTTNLVLPTQTMNGSFPSLRLRNRKNPAFPKGSRPDSQNMFTFF